MRTATYWTTRLLSCALVVALCGIPELLQAQSLPQASSRASSAEAPPLQDQRAPQDAAPDQGASAESSTPAGLPDAPSSTQLPLTVAQAQNTSAPPVNPPAQSQTPNATSAAPATTPAPDQQATPAQNKPAEQPVGAAAAQAGVTSGGAVSKPAGMAIAPAKQRQVRSLLIKLGAIAAGGAAIGAVVGLSKGSPSKPPGAK